MYKIKSILFVLFTIVAASNAQATIVIHGFLATDDTTDFITDTTTGRLYTRFDAFNLSYADTLTAIGSGGMYEGWSVATAAVSDDFIAASLGLSSTPCTGHVAYGTACGNVSGWSDGDFGLSYQHTVDLYAYENGLPGHEISLVQFSSDGAIRDLANWQSISHLDEHGGSVYPANPINLLLYKEQTGVPASSAASFFMYGVALLVFRRLRGLHR